jgi:hypothetical protein
MDPTRQRGYFNNNPGNLDRVLSDEPWQGEIRNPNDPRLSPFQKNEIIYGRFCVFDTAEHGLRALVKNLIALRDRLGDHTANQFIGAWAPPGENNTAAYVARVCAVAEVGPDDPINIGYRPIMREFVIAITDVEEGGNPYPPALIEQAMTDAGIAL